MTTIFNRIFSRQTVQTAAAVVAEAPRNPSVKPSIAYCEREIAATVAEAMSDLEKISYLSACIPSFAAAVKDYRTFLRDTVSFLTREDLTPRQMYREAERVFALEATQTGIEFYRNLMADADALIDRLAEVAALNS